MTLPDHSVLHDNSHKACKAVIKILSSRWNWFFSVFNSPSSSHYRWCSMCMVDQNFNWWRTFFHRDEIFCWDEKWIKRFVIWSFKVSNSFKGLRELRSHLLASQVRGSSCVYTMNIILVCLQNDLSFHCSGFCGCVHWQPRKSSPRRWMGGLP